MTELFRKMACETEDAGARRDLMSLRGHQAVCGTSTKE
ncbi:hypothetical protein APTSU1_001103200 [Apodemus speciosus]|uniref:Uncharacterized protein n=1 Tax=Apodemus speciosus TaxID=105296 RepID=A0ABQ0F955_APOSI